MPQRTFFWHMINAPDGREFDIEKVSVKMLEEQGWVDHPYKAHSNPWGGDSTECDRVYNEFKAGKIKAMGSYELDRTPSEMDILHQKEKEALYEQLKLQEEQTAALRRQLKEAREKEADEESDAAKISAKSVGKTAAASARRKRASAKQEPPSYDDPDLDFEEVA